MPLVAGCRARCSRPAGGAALPSRRAGASAPDGRSTGCARGASWPSRTRWSRRAPPALAGRLGREADRASTPQAPCRPRLSRPCAQDGAEVGSPSPADDFPPGGGAAVPWSESSRGRGGRRRRCATVALARGSGIDGSALPPRPSLVTTRPPPWRPTSPHAGGRGPCSSSQAAACPRAGCRGPRRWCGERSTRRACGPRFRRLTGPSPAVTWQTVRTVTSRRCLASRRHGVPGGRSPWRTGPREQGDDERVDRARS